MRLDKNLLELLHSKTANVHDIPISRKQNAVLTRIDYITSVVSGKSVIHVGCADHKNLIDQKIKQDIWLHKKLAEETRLLLGIDINKEAIDYIRNTYGYPNILCFDIVKDTVPEQIKDKQWDYMVLGEVLEHVDNPIEFLKMIHRKYNSYVDRILVTGPNALRLINFRNVLKLKERINTDHRYWFTPFTLSKIFSLAGFKVEIIEYCHFKGFKTNVLFRYLLKKYPPFRNNLVLIAQF